MVTHGVHQLGNLPAGRWREFTAMAQEISPGIWFPVEWRNTDFGSADPNTNEQPAVAMESFTVMDLKLNPVIEPNRFTWKALPLPAGVQFMRQDSSGEISMGSVVNGELVFGASLGKPVASN